MPKVEEKKVELEKEQKPWYKRAWNASGRFIKGLGAGIADTSYEAAGIDKDESVKGRYKAEAAKDANSKARTVGRAMGKGLSGGIANLLKGLFALLIGAMFSPTAGLAVGIASFFGATKKEKQKDENGKEITVTKLDDPTNEIAKSVQQSVVKRYVDVKPSNAKSADAKKEAAKPDALDVDDDSRGIEQMDPETDAKQEDVKNAAAKEEDSVKLETNRESFGINTDKKKISMDQLSDAAKQGRSLDDGDFERHRRPRLEPIERSNSKRAEQKKAPVMGGRKK